MYFFHTVCVKLSGLKNILIWEVQSNVFVKLTSTHCNVTSNILSAMDVTHNDIHFQSHQFILTYNLVNNSALASKLSFTIFLKHKCFLKTGNFFPSKETSDSCNYYKGNYYFQIQVLSCATQSLVPELTAHFFDDFHTKFRISAVSPWKHSPVQIISTSPHSTDTSVTHDGRTWKTHRIHVIQESKWRSLYKIQQQTSDPI